MPYMREVDDLDQFCRVQPRLPEPLALATLFVEHARRHQHPGAAAVTEKVQRPMDERLRRLLVADRLVAALAPLQGNIRFPPPHGVLRPRIPPGRVTDDNVGAASAESPTHGFVRYSFLDGEGVGLQQNVETTTAV